MYLKTNYFEELYKAKDEKFLKLIDLLCVKDDKEVKKLILDVNNKIDLIEDKNAYLDSYVEKFYNDEFINNIILDYEKLLFNK